MRSLILLLAVASVAAGETPKFVQPPKLPSTETRMPAIGSTAASQSASSPQRLTTDLLFVIDSDVELLVLPSPLDRVTIEKDTGPVKMRGRFIDSPAKVQTKTFAGKFIYTVEAAHTGPCELIIVPVGASDESKVIRRQLAVVAGEGPQPPPIDDDKKPIPAGKLAHWVLVEETAQAAANRGNVVVAAITWSKSAGVKHSIVDQNQVAADVQTYIADARKKGIPQLYLVTKDGEALWSGKPPGTPEEFVALLKRFGGQ